MEFPFVVAENAISNIKERELAQLSHNKLQFACSANLRKHLNSRIRTRYPLLNLYIVDPCREISYILAEAW